jgi:hypothetical protein
MLALQVVMRSDRDFMEVIHLEHTAWNIWRNIDAYFYFSKNKKI